MAETDVHRDQMVDLIYALQLHFQEQDHVYVSGNILLYYEEGNKRRHVSPDVLVTLGIPRGKRDYYLLWVEGKAPDLVLEISSASTCSEDLGIKRDLYAKLGVKEYCLFDPLREYLKPPLRLYRLSRGKYRPVTRYPLRLTTVGLELQILDHRLRLKDPKTGRPLPTPMETSIALAEKEALLSQQELLVAQQQAALLEKDTIVAKQKAALKKKDAALAEMEQRIKELEAQLRNKL